MEETSEEIHIVFPEGSFRRVFQDQQIKNVKQKDSRQISTWHPLIIKWCLNMTLISSASYAMHTAGFITLPSGRTLRDYTNYIAESHVIQQEVVHQMRQEAMVNDLYDVINVVESTGLKLIADGDSPNRTFFRMHESGGRTIYKTKSAYANDDILFISDPLHLIKTTAGPTLIVIHLADLCR